MVIIFFLLVLLDIIADFDDVSIMCQDGVLIANKFIEWENIEGYRLNKEDKMNTYLEIKRGKKSLIARVSNSQVSLINELFKIKNIKKI